MVNVPHSFEMVEIVSNCKTGFIDYLILEQHCEGLDELKLEILGKSANVVVRLNSLLALSLLLAFENIGINSTLCKIGYTLKRTRLICEYVYEFLAYDLTLAFGIGYSCEEVKESVRRIYVDEIYVHLILEDLNDVFGLVLAHKPVVNVDAIKLLADSLCEECCYYGGVNAAGKGEKHLLIANLLFDELYLLFYELVCELFVCNTLKIFGTYDVLHKNILQKLMDSDSSRHSVFRYAKGMIRCPFA